MKYIINFDVGIMCVATRGATGYLPAGGAPQEKQREFFGPSKDFLEKFCQNGASSILG